MADEWLRQNDKLVFLNLPSGGRGVAGTLGSGDLGSRLAFPQSAGTGCPNNVSLELCV